MDGIFFYGFVVTTIFKYLSSSRAIPKIDSASELIISSILKNNSCKSVHGAKSLREPNRLVICHKIQKQLGIPCYGKGTTFIIGPMYARGVNGPFLSGGYCTPTTPQTGKYYPPPGPRGTLPKSEMGNYA